MGENTLPPKRTSLEIEPPRWLMPWISLFFTSKPPRNTAPDKMSDALSTPWPPRPAITMLVGSLCGILLLSNFDHARGEQAGAAANEQGQLVLGEGGSHDVGDGVGFQDGIKHPDVLDTKRPRQVFEAELAGRLMVQAAAGAGVFLQSSHCLLYTSPSPR